jgi:hypothetical protein
MPAAQVLRQRGYRGEAAMWCPKEGHDPIAAAAPTYTRSRISAMPWPTPMHIVHSA